MVARNRVGVEVGVKRELSLSFSFRVKARFSFLLVCQTNSASYADKENRSLVVAIFFMSIFSLQWPTTPFQNALSIKAKLAGMKSAILLRFLACCSCFMRPIEQLEFAHHFLS